MHITPIIIILKFSFENASIVQSLHIYTFRIGKGNIIILNPGLIAMLYYYSLHWSDFNDSGKILYNTIPYIRRQDN